MRSSSFILTAILLSLVSANAQVKPDLTLEEKPYRRVQEVDLSPPLGNPDNRFENTEPTAVKDLFTRGWANVSDPDTYIFKLGKGQKLRVSIGWRELPQGIVDPTGTIDHSRNGFTITGPDGKVIRNTKNKFVIDPPKAGVYTIIVKPYYKKRNKLASSKEKPEDYDYRFDYALLPAK